MRFSAVQLHTILDFTDSVMKSIDIFPNIEPNTSIAKSEF